MPYLHFNDRFPGEPQLACVLS